MSLAQDNMRPGPPSTVGLLRHIRSVSLLALWLLVPPPLSGQAEGSLRLGAVLGTVGVLEGDRYQEFGEVTSVAILRNGRVAVLDGKLSRLSLFDRTGKFIATSGRPGSGPGEFRIPKRVLAQNDSTILVLDYGLSRISAFRIRADSITFTHSMRAASPAEDACLLGDTLFVAGARMGTPTTIQRLGLDGAARGAFGTLLLDAPDPVLATLSSQGMRIACLPQAGLILLAGKWLPRVLAFDPSSGALVWSMEIPSFRRTVIERTGTGVAFKAPPDQTVHLLTDMVVAPTGHTVLVQLERMWRSAPGGSPESAFETRLLLLDGRGGTVVGQPEPIRIHAYGYGLAAIADTADYPRLLLRSVR